MTETRARTIKGIVGSIIKISETGNAAIDTSFTAIRASRLVSVTIKFDTQPVISEPLTVTLNAAAGSAYDVLLYCSDPSGFMSTDFVIGTDDWGSIYLVDKDKIDVAYANSSSATYGLQITIEELV